MLLVSSAREENWAERGVRVMVALRKEFGVAPDAISGIATAPHSATLAPMQTVETKPTQSWDILRMFTDYTAGKVRAVCASPDAPHDATGRFDSVLANPPFKVNAVDKERLKDQVGSNRRFTFGVPRTDNANYLWIQLFHSALNGNSRAGFGMATGGGNGHSCSMKIPKDVPKYAAEQGSAEKETLKKGIEAKSKEFVESGAFIYRQVEQAGKLQSQTNK